MPTAPIQDWGDAIMASLTGALALFFAAIPKILGFLVIVVVGWVLASLVAKAIGALLRAIKFNDLAARSGFADFVQKMGVETDSAGFIAGVAKWFVRLIALVVAFDALGLPAVSDVLRQLLLWLPNVVVALVVLVIGGLAANAVSKLVRGATSEAELGNPNLLANVARIAIWAFAIVIAVNQIGIATTLVNTLFMGTVAALALVVGLAFGLGSRDVAGEIVRNWYQKSQGTAAKVKRAADVAGELAKNKTGPGSSPPVPH